MLCVNELIGFGVPYRAPAFVGALDYRPGAEIAVGLKRLYSSWTGALIRVRNPDTNVESDIGYDALGALDAAAVATAQGASLTLPIVTIYDQSGNGRNYTQGTSTRQPLLTANGPGGAFCIEFDGSNDYMEAAGLSLPQPFSRYMAFSTVAHGAFKYLADGLSAGTTYDRAAFFANSTTPRHYIYASTTLGPVDFAIGSWHIAAKVFNDASSSLRRNKTAATTGAGGGGGGASLSGATLGARGDGTQNANVRIAGSVLFGAADDTTAQDLVIDGMASAFGVSV